MTNTKNNATINIPFTKMNGLGNDFILVDDVSLSVNFLNYKNYRTIIQKMSNRKRGIGCDQFLILTTCDHADVFMHIYNQDGSRAGACGNATRCVAHIIMQRNNTTKTTIQTDNGILYAWYNQEQSIKNNTHNSHSNDTSLISINMGKPTFDKQSIPLAKDAPLTNEQTLDFSMYISTGHDTVSEQGFCVNFGNPHIVFATNDAEKISLETLGPLIEHHPYFPERTNVEFLSKIDDTTYRMRVWERGGMITDACGSGGCASFIASQHYYNSPTNTPITITMDGGDLIFHYDPHNNVIMTGPYEYNFDGVFYINNL